MCAAVLVLSRLKAFEESGKGVAFFPKVWLKDCSAGARSTHTPPKGVPLQYTDTSPNKSQTQAVSHAPRG